ncbi:hypothetical protein AVEN_25542-1 [Araneus ventricosus]|uniref:Uncharacterized protein n=1 Tax=Araneus ventricosus TaxID=182803 RepID=A0A4Y2T0B8_ARAVE|nr:hypothetical protein AVEN_25542-1 [Araneus ventricosus]
MLKFSQFRRINFTIFGRFCNQDISKDPWGVAASAIPSISPHSQPVTQPLTVCTQQLQSVAPSHSATSASLCSPSPGFFSPGPEAQTMTQSAPDNQRCWEKLTRRFPSKHIPFVA